MKGFELLGLPIIARIHLISLVPCSAFSVWVLKHLVTPIMRSLLWHVCCSFSPFMWIRVYLTCVCVSQVWCASRVSEFALQLQGKLAPAPFASSHVSSFVLSTQIICLIWLACIRSSFPMDDASISNGLRRKQGFLLVIAMMEMNERCWLRLGSSTFWATEDGKSSGWQGWCFPPEIYYDLGPTLRRPTLGHLFWHSHIVMTIILRRSLTLQTRNCEIRYFWPWPCKYFCAASGQLEIPFCTVPLYSMIPVLDCYYIVPSRFCDRYLMEFWFVTAMRYLFLQSSLAWTHRLVGRKVSCSIIPSSGRLNQIDIHVSCIFEGRMSRKCILKG